MYNPEVIRANRAYYFSIGRCPRCGGKNPLEPGFKRCKPCALKESARRAELRKTLFSRGLCPSCGKPRDDAAFKTCSRCRAHTREYIAEKKSAEKKNGGDDMSTSATITQQEIAEATGMPAGYVSEALYSVKAATHDRRPKQYDTKEALEAVLNFSEHRRRAVEDAAARKTAKWDSFIGKIKDMMEA